MRTAAGWVARAAIACAGTLGVMGPAAQAQGFDLYRVEEASIADIRRAFETATTASGSRPRQASPPITVPMGWIDGSLPAGLQFLGRPWSEGTLIRLVYAYEQAIRHQRPPPSVPPLLVSAP